jgi:hypothetical protein
VLFPQRPPSQLYRDIQITEETIWTQIRVERKSHCEDLGTDGGILECTRHLKEIWCDEWSDVRIMTSVESEHGTSN